MPREIRTAGLEAAQEARSRASASSSNEPVLEGAAAAEPSDKDEVSADGWVRRKVAKASSKVTAMSSGLGVFRVNLTRWSSHNQYQVLAFSGGRISAAESAARKHPTCTAVDAVDVELCT